MSRPTLVIDNELTGGLSLAERRIRDTARYVTQRVGTMVAGEAWFDIGRELSELKVFLAKESKSDPEHSGWNAAFTDDRFRFPFVRRYADDLIEVHTKIAGGASPRKSLPVSVRALIALARLPDSHRAEVVKQCTPVTTAPQVKRLALEAGVVFARKKVRPSFDRAYEAFRRALRALPKRRRIEEYRALAIDLEIKEVLRDA